MIDWSVVFLGLIAAATVIMALIQIGVLVAGARLAKHVQVTLGAAQQTIATAEQTITSLREEVRPLIANAVAVAGEASKSAALATAQAEKIDRLVTDLARRVDGTAAVVQEAIVAPAREGIAIIAAVKGALAAFRQGSDPRRRTSRSEEEDPLFIG